MPKSAVDLKGRFDQQWSICWESKNKIDVWDAVFDAKTQRVVYISIDPNRYSCDVKEKDSKITPVSVVSILDKDGMQNYCCLELRKTKQ